MSLDVHRLRILRELERRGTLAAVARALAYSPSAISQQLAQLEAETGVTLLEHVGRGVRLTPQARLLVGHADAVLERLEQAEADLAASLHEVRGTLRVGAFQSVLLALVPPALARLAAEHPGLRVEFTQVESEDAFASLLAHDHDLVLADEYPGMPLPRLAAVHEEDLADDEIRLAVPPDRAGSTVSDLADAPWALDPVGTAPRAWAIALCRAAGFEPDIRFESPDLLLAVHLVERGLAAALLPDLVWWDRPATVALHPLPGRPRRRLFTAVRRGSAGHPAVVAFRTALRAALVREGSG